MGSATSKMLRKLCEINKDDALAGQFQRLGHLVIEHIPFRRRRGDPSGCSPPCRTGWPTNYGCPGSKPSRRANAWLKAHYIAEHNARFAVAPEQEGSAFIPLKLGVALPRGIEPLFSP